MADSAVWVMDRCARTAPKLAEELGRLVVIGDRGTASGSSADLYVVPGDAAIPAGADGFHGGFFGGEASGVALCLVGFGFAIANLFGREDALEKTTPEALDGLGDPPDFRDIDTGADDHGRCFAVRHWLFARMRQPQLGILQAGAILVRLRRSLSGDKRIAKNGPCEYNVTH